MTKRQIKNNLKGCQELLDYYLGKKYLMKCFLGENRCPLCHYSEFNCKQCAWHTIEGISVKLGNPCVTWCRNKMGSRDMGSFRDVKHPEFIKKRIPMLRRWIKKLKEMEKK